MGTGKGTGNGPGSTAGGVDGQRAIARAYSGMEPARGTRIGSGITGGVVDGRRAPLQVAIQVTLGFPRPLASRAINSCAARQLARLASSSFRARLPQEPEKCRR